MRKLFTILSLAVALLAVSCSEDTTTDLPIGGNGTTDSPVEGDEPMTYITVGIDDNTRIGVGEEENGKVALLWSEGDKLVVNKTTTSGAVSAEYAGKNTAVIGVPAATTYPMTLVYPSAVRKGAKWFFIDAEQTYNPAKLANGWAILMGVAEEAGDIVRLEHKCGYMKVSLTGSTTVKRVMLRTIGHEPLSGYFRFPTTSATDGKIGMVRFNGANAMANGCFDSPLVAVNCGDGVTLSGEPTDFYFALPVANYSKGFELTIINAEGKQHCVTAYTSSGKDVKAGALIEMPTLTVDCTEEQGIYNGNELAGYVRTLEKDVWLDILDGKTLHIRGEADLSGESFDDLDAALQESRVAGELFYWRDPAAEEDTYNCLSITTIDGHDNAITGYNSTVTAAGAGLLFHEIPATMTVKNLTLGKTADNPATDANEADCTLTATGTGSTTSAINEFAAFCYKLSGTVSNCVNNASVTLNNSSAGAIYVAGMCGSTSTGAINNSTNKGAIYCNGSSATGDDQVVVAGIVPKGAVVISKCRNEGNITCYNNALAARVAGIIGETESDLSDCVNTGAIKIDTPKVGSRIAGITSSTTATITSCVNEGDVTVSNAGYVIHTGGVTGYTSNAVTTSTNKGNIDVTITGENNSYVGGVVGISAFTNAELNGCVNGEKDTQKGAIKVTHNGGSNVYAGGVVGWSNKVAAYKNMTNYGPITISGSNINYAYIGCVGGYNNTTGTTYDNCNNYGKFTLNATSAQTNYNYIGGVSGANSNNTCTISNSANYGDVVLDASTMKVRYGGMAGNLGNNVSNCHAEFDITINQVAASSAIGGFAGYMPKSGAVIDGCSYKGTITNNDPDADATVKIASLFASSQNITCHATSVEPTMVNNAGAPAFGLIGGAVNASRTLTLGAADKPFQISKKSKFLGISVSESTVTNHSSDEGASGKAYLDCSSDANKFTITKTNLVYVD
ncbi:MAG: hypothetical protein IJE21_00515 [Alistipes sp.]|nr:hypothetical protein [Alistipes sp.]